MSVQRKYIQYPLKHSGSRMSEMIRQHNIEKNERVKNDYAEALNTEFEDSLHDDEDWALQETLEQERKHPIKNQVSFHKSWHEMLRLWARYFTPMLALLQEEDSYDLVEENEKASPEEMVPVTTVEMSVHESSNLHYDFPKEPPKPAIPPRTPKGTLLKHSSLSSFSA